MALLELRDAVIGYGSLKVVQGVSLAFDRGDFISIIGPNGAGKTTLIGAMSGNLPLADGTIWFDGVDITTWKADQRSRSGIGRSFQKTNLFSGLTATQNVNLAVQGRRGIKLWQMMKGPVPDVHEETMYWLSQVELSSKADTKASALAHGDKRKLEMAMLLAQRPKVLLLDEPTAGMSVAETGVILDLISHLKSTREYTIVLVEHKLDVVMELSDKVTVLHQGRVLTSGSPDEVMQSAEVERAYLGGHHGHSA